MSITAEEIKAARGLIKWSQLELALNANVDRNTIANIEAGRSRGSARILYKLQAALEAAGVDFITENGGGAGVRLRKSAVSQKVLQLREKIASIRGRIEAAKANLDQVTLDDLTSIASQENYASTDSETDLAVIFANLIERAALVVKRCPKMKNEFPELAS